MHERGNPADGLVRVTGSEPCGCSWEKSATAVGAIRGVVFMTRCAAHRPMCRNLERWELDLLL